jgi:hypothetical protein
MLNDRDLMLRFCSLGNNCEFGFAQRAYGAEPLDLLRWGSTDYRILTRMLRERFEHIGAGIELWRQPTGHRMLRHRHYKFDGHVFEGDDVTDEAVIDGTNRRLPRLAAKLLEDIAEAERIFVLWPTDARPNDPRRAATETDAAVIAALIAPATLLFVREGDLRVVSAGANLLHGYIPRFAEPARVTVTTPAADWLELCRMAHALKRRDIAHGTGGVPDHQPLLHRRMRSHRAKAAEHGRHCPVRRDAATADLNRAAASLQ